MIAKSLRKYALGLQEEIDRLTEKLKRPNIHDHDYFDGRNDALIEVLTKLEKILDKDGEL